MSATGGANVYLLDYGAGNVLSVANAVKAVGGELNLIKEAADFDKVHIVHVLTAAHLATLRPLLLLLPLIFGVHRGTASLIVPSKQRQPGCACPALFCCSYYLLFVPSPKAEKIIFPGVGSFGSCMAKLESLGYVECIKKVQL